MNYFHIISLLRHVQKNLPHFENQNYTLLRIQLLYQPPSEKLLVVITKTRLLRDQSFDRNLGYIGGGIGQNS